jgi:nucleoside-diphosphate-sugar epimerase
VFVTGATGLVGSWLTRRLVEAQADVVCLVRDWVPQSELVRANLIERVKIMRGERPIIRSDGSYIRDYFYVEDGAAAYMLLAEQMARRPELWGEAFNFSNELQITVLDLTQRVLAVMDSSLTPDVRNEASNEILHQYLSAAKARELLGWSPLFTLEQGLEKTVAWYREFITALDGEAALARRAGRAAG